MDNGSNADSGGSGCGCLLVAGVAAYYVVPFAFKIVFGMIGILLQLIGQMRQ